MFFMMGINPGRKELNHDQMIICSQCGAYGRYRVYMTYMCLTLFFIPCFRWNRQYYVETTCCGTVYELDPAVGKRIARGENVEIEPQNLRQVRSGRGAYRRCPNCGYETQEDFEFCPRCGRHF